MNALVTIIKKEVKEILRDKNTIVGVILIPIILFPLIGRFVVIASQGEETIFQKVNVAVLNLDRGQIASDILRDNITVQNLIQSGIYLIILNELGIHTRYDAIDYLEANASLDLLIIFPENFSSCIQQQIPAIIESYYVIRSNIPSQEEPMIVSYALQKIKDAISAYVIKNINPNANPVFVQNPIYPYTTTIYRGKEYKGVPPGALIGTLSFQMMFLPILMMILIMSVISTTAMSVAGEKEQKTLETLLTLPVKRTTIVLGKIFGAIVISLLGLISYSIGMKLYMDSIMEITSESFGMSIEIGFIYSPQDMILIAVAMFIALLTNALIGILIGTLAEDTKSAGTITGTILAPIFAMSFMIPFLFMRGLNITTLIIASAIPFVSPTLIMIVVLMREYISYAIMLIIMLVEFVVLLIVTARIYKTEKILTLRLKLRRRK